MEAFSALGEFGGPHARPIRRPGAISGRNTASSSPPLMSTAAQIVTVRLLIRNRRDDLDPLASKALLDETRRAAMAELDFAAPTPGPRALHEGHDENALAALRQRCDEVLREARVLAPSRRGRLRFGRAACGVIVAKVAVAAIGLNPRNSYSLAQ